MKFKRFLILASSITFFSVLYVYQQSEIVRLAYAGQKSQIIMQNLLDQNSVLRYHIQKNSSLVKLGDGVIENSDLEMPERYQVVRLVSSSAGVNLGKLESGKQNILLRILGLASQAEAKPANP